MMNIRKLRIISFVFFVLLLLLPQISFAYLDPGTGSYIYQLIIAGIVGASFAIKVFWTKIKLFFVNLFSNKAHDEKDK